MLLASGIHTELQSAQGGTQALSLTSQVLTGWHSWDVSYHAALFPVLTDELHHRDGAGAYNQAIQGLEVLQASGGQQSLGG